MGSSVFTIGLTGLNAANLGLTTAGHNISNVNTEGYSRQQIRQSAPYPSLTGSGYVGLGTRVDTIVRSYDQFITRQLQTTQAKASYYDSYSAHIAAIDNLVADSSAGVAPAMQNYFAAVQNVASNPSNIPARQALLSSSQTLVNRFQSVNQLLTDQRNALNGEISNTTSSINALAKQIADINGQIVLSSGSGQPPNDLLDQRDQMVKDLNKLVKASTVEQTDGSINVFIGNGQNLVVGGQTFSLAAIPSPADPLNVTVVYKQNNNTVYLPENSLNGGQLGALLDFRTNSLNLAQNSLGRVAMGMAEMFNAQQRAGMDLNGKMGQNLFDYARQSSLSVTLSGATINISSASAAIPSSDFSLAYNGASYVLTRMSDNSTQAITAAQMAAGYTALGVTVQSGSVPGAAASSSWSFPPDIGSLVPSSLNTGTAVLDGYVSDVAALTTSNYTLDYDGTNYVLTRLSDNTQTVSATLPLTVDGMSLRLASGAIAAGDSYSIKPYEGFINSLSVKMTDPRDVAAAAPIRLTSGKTAAGVSVTNTGTATLTQPVVDTPSTVTTSTVNTALKNPVNIVFDSAANAFNVTDTVTGTTTAFPYTAGMTLSFNGWSLKITGQPANGDTFSVGVNTAGTEDGRNALQLSALQTSKFLSGGTATLGQSYSQMVSAIGTQASEIETMSSSQATMLEQAQTARDSVSGVNLDEEAASLLRYQQAYVAASKVIQIAQQAFEEIAKIV